jgi:RimJ/RimL family protein N-acetyltransferase
MMKRPAAPPPPPPALAEGYTFRYWQPGDRERWIGIETSVLEVDDYERAVKYYDHEFGRFPDELAKRQLFAVSPSGEYIGTSSAWWVDTPQKRRLPIVHWVAVKPEHQGKGLGKAVVAETLRNLCGFNGGADFYLTSSTYSHKALHLYRSLGFTFDAESPWPWLDTSDNQTAEAVAYLDKLGLL